MLGELYALDILGGDLFSFNASRTHCLAVSSDTEDKQNSRSNGSEKVKTKHLVSMFFSKI